MLHNFKQVLIAFDQLVYCIFGTFFGIFNSNVKVYADMTVSAQAYSLAQRGYWYGRVLEKVINCIFWDKDHCKNSYQAELENKHLPEDMR